MGSVSADPLEALLTEALGMRIAWSNDEEIFCLCPYHDDRRPGTWSLNRATGAHWCFACSRGGSLDDLIRREQGGTYWNTLGLLEEFGVKLVAEELPDSYHALRKAKVVTHRILSEQALEGLTLPPQKEREKRSLTREACQRCEVLWDPERGLWVLPIRLFGGALIGWQEKKGRYVSNEPLGVKKSATLFGIHRPSWEAAILVESPLDTARLYAAGYDGGVSSYGVAVHNDQMRLVLDKTDTLVLALDNDKYGRATTRRLVKEWGGRFKLSVLNYQRAEGCKDVGEMTDAEIEWALDHAVDSTEYE